MSTTRVLFVCTGNVCRSPMGEWLLRSRLPDVEVSSAGTAALVGHPMDGPSADALRRLGIDPSRHRARRLSPDLLTGVDLVLTAEEHHRRAILVEAPGLLRRTFTIEELIRLATDLGPDALRALDDPADRIAAVAARRGSAPPPRPGADDLPDPYRGSPRDADRCAARVVAVTDLLVDVLHEA